MKYPTQLAITFSHALRYLSQFDVLKQTNFFTNMSLFEIIFSTVSNFSIFIWVWNKRILKHCCTVKQTFQFLGTFTQWIEWANWRTYYRTWAIDPRCQDYRIKTFLSMMIAWCSLVVFLVKIQCSLVSNEKLISYISYHMSFCNTIQFHVLLMVL